MDPFSLFFSDPITSLIILGALVGVVVVVAGLRRRGRSTGSASSAVPTVSTATGADVMALETRFGWVSEDATVLLRNRDRALRQTVNTALDAKYKGEFAEAIRLYRACLTRPDGTPQETATLLILLGNCFLEQGKMEQAVGHYREAQDVVAAALGRPV